MMCSGFSNSVFSFSFWLKICTELACSYMQHFTPDSNKCALTWGAFSAPESCSCQSISAF